MRAHAFRTGAVSSGAVRRRAGAALWPALALLCALMVVSGCDSSTPSAQRSPTQAAPQTLLALVSDGALKQYLYPEMRHTADQVAASGASGAVGANLLWEQRKQPRWYIEEQRQGGDLVQAGVAMNDATEVQAGLKELDWGFARQGPDGDFPGTGDPFHSTSFFVEASARALLLLRQRDATTYASVLAADIPKTQAAAAWLMRPEVAATGQQGNQPYTHRRWLLAAALGETAALTGDAAMAQAAAAYARDGLALQRADGVNPELGGYDVNYQTVGIFLAAQYALVCTDASLRSQALGMIARGLKWETTRIDAQGRINADGSTRVLIEQGRSGQTKSVGYGIVFRALVFGAALTGDASFAQVAQRLARYCGAPAQGFSCRAHQPTPLPTIAVGEGD